MTEMAAVPIDASANGLQISPGPQGGWQQRSAMYTAMTGIAVVPS